jgi:hypothetical protein
MFCATVQSGRINKGLIRFKLIQDYFYGHQDYWLDCSITTNDEFRFYFTATIKFCLKVIPTRKLCFAGTRLNSFVITVEHR